MTLRVALYARFSSDLQNERSADDQLSVLRQVAIVRGWREVRAYADRGISGASMINRPAIRDLMREAKTGAFDVVFAEDLDRLSRDQEDTAHIFKRLNHLGIAMETIAQGRITVMHVGLAGTMNQLQLEQIAYKTRRGLVARVKAGFSGGGRCYGYDLIPAAVGEEKGRFEIDEPEADVIRRAFEMFAKGDSTRVIARTFNAEDIPAPRRGVWSPTTLSGDRRAGDGILCQELYIGVRVFNRRRFRKDPDTGRRASILNPPEQWVRVPAPDLRIVSDGLWDAARARLAAISGQPRGVTRKPKRLLSGLLRCGVCSGSMVLYGGKYACTAHREKGTCRNNKIIAAAAVERRVIEGVRDRLLSPAIIAEAVRTYHADMEAEHKAAGKDRQALENELAELERRIDRAADSYERGVFEVDELARRVAPLKTRKADILLSLAAAEKPQHIRLHPKAADYYREMVERVHDALEGDDAEEVRTEFRLLIERVDFTPLPGLGLYGLDVHGKLAALLGISERAAAYTSDCEVGVGAGTRSGRNLTPLHVSFAA